MVLLGVRKNSREKFKKNQRGHHGKAITIYYYIFSPKLHSGGENGRPTSTGREIRVFVFFVWNEWLVGKQIHCGRMGEEGAYG